MNRKGDTFDKEFRMENKKKKKGSSRGKFPSWLLILAGVAVIGGVVAARQPSLRPVENTTKTSITLPTNQPAVAEQAASITAINDQQADSAELEARFLSKANAQYIVPVQTNGSQQGINMDLEPLTIDSSGNPASPQLESSSSIVWIEGKPFALSIEAIGDAAQPQSVTSVYWLNDQPYDVHLDPISETDISQLSQADQSSVVHIGNQDYLLRMTKTVSTETAAAEPTPTQPSEMIHAADTAPVSDKNMSTEEKTGAEDQPAVAWLDSKPYAVTVKPQDKASAGQPIIDNISEDTSEDSRETKKETINNNFTIDGKEYILSMEEVAPDEIPDSSASIVWLDKTPLEVILSSKEESADAEPVIEVSLNPLSSEQTAALQQERFGTDFETEETPETETIIISTEEPTQTVEETQGGNWFTNMFTGIFGSSPTNTPTPQVTVIALSPTPAPVQPTATPIVIQMAAVVPTQQGPVKLDGTDVVNTTERNQETADTVSDANKTDQSVTPTVKPTLVPTKAAPEKIEVVVLDETDSTVQPTAQTEAKELPQTGMAEGWNIPSMLGLLAGLLLVIIGVRRLRSRE